MRILNGNFIIMLELAVDFLEQLFAQPPVRAVLGGAGSDYEESGEKIKSAHLFESFIPLVDSGLVIPELEIIAIRQTGLRGFNCPPPTPSPLPPPPSLTWCCEPRTPYPRAVIYCETACPPWLYKFYNVTNMKGKMCVSHIFCTGFSRVYVVSRNNLR